MASMGLAPMRSDAGIGAEVDLELRNAEARARIIDDEPLFRQPFQQFSTQKILKILKAVRDGPGVRFGRR
jgi:hypothetical protein